MPTEINWLGEKVKADFQAKLHGALTAAGAYMVGAIRLEIRADDLIDTGNLINSITTWSELDTGPAAEQISVGTHVFYAIFLEFGTVVLPAYGFMRRAMEQNASAVQAIARATLGG